MHTSMYTNISLQNNIPLLTLILIFKLILIQLFQFQTLPLITSFPDEDFVHCLLTWQN